MFMDHHVRQHDKACQALHYFIALLRLSASSIGGDVWHVIVQCLPKVCMIAADRVGQLCTLAVAKGS